MLPKPSSVMKSITLALGVLFATGSADTAKVAAPKAVVPKTAASPSKATGAGAPTTASAAAPASGATEAPVTEETIVYLAKSGSRYHQKGCKYLKNSGKQVTIITAMKQGYAPCNVCKAPHLKRQ